MRPMSWHITYLNTVQMIGPLSSSCLILPFTSWIAIASELSPGLTPRPSIEMTGEAETSCSPSALMAFLDGLESPDRKSTADTVGRPIRGPSLARLQLLWRLKQDGREEELDDMIDGVQLLRMYLWRFGARPCCLADIKPYLGLIQQSQAQQFLSTLLDSLPNDPDKETGMRNATLALSNSPLPANKVKLPSNSSALICPDDGIDQALDVSSPHLVLQCLSNGGFNASVDTEACNSLGCAADESSNNGTLPFGNLTPTHSNEELLSDNATSSSFTLSPMSSDNPCSLAELTIKETQFSARENPLLKQSPPVNKDAVRVSTGKGLPANEMAPPTSIETPMSSLSSTSLPKVFPPFPRGLEAQRRGECLAALARVLGLHLSLEADVRLKLAQTAARLFRHTLTLDECLLRTDMRPGEGFCLLATHLLLDEWRESGQGRAIWRALGLLEWAVMQCPAAPQLRLAQLRLYGEIGALSGSLAAYAALEPKHVQHESMGYLVMSQVPASGQFFTAGLVYSPLLKFHRAQHKETAEYIIQAFKFGSFAQVPEVVSFRERLSASLDLALARTELALLVTLVGITPQGNQSLQESIAMAMEGDTIPWDHLRDNRDFDISQTFEPNEQLPHPSDLSRSIETSRLWLRIRALTLRGVTIATAGLAKGSGSTTAVEVPESAGGNAATTDGIPASMVVNGGGVEEAGINLSALSSLLRELIAIYRLLEENEPEEKAREKVVKQPVFLPANPPLRDFICSGTWRCHLEAFNLTHALLTLHNCGITHDESSTIQNKICGHFNALRDHFEDTCLACRGSLIDESLGPHDLRPQPGLLHRLAFAAETTCLVVVVVMGLAVTMLRPQRSLLQRRRKKRKDPQVPQSVPALTGYQEFVVAFEAAVNKLLGIVGEHVLDLRNVHYAPSPLLDQHQEEERANQKVVWENVRNSYSRSLEDIETILRKCLDTIQSHKL
uniref:N-alpha-acetyltransferase 25, NatB auxiliary subunit isoform X3 n=1 Tax=Myxine glutinosa TaxID=7769 RepID=UPI00358F9ADF